MAKPLFSIPPMLLRSVESLSHRHDRDFECVVIMMVVMMAALIAMTVVIIIPMVVSQKLSPPASVGSNQACLA